MKYLERPSTEKPQKGFLYGMDYLSFLWDENGADYQTGFRLLKNLGVRCILAATWRIGTPSAPPP